MPETSTKKVQAEIVESLPLDERMIRAFEKIAEKTSCRYKSEIIAPLWFTEKKRGNPDSAAALIHIDEESRDELNKPYRA